MKLGILKEKKFGAPIWVWALIAGVIVFILYRRYRAAGAGAAQTAPVTTPTGANASQGDLLSGGIGNAGNDLGVSTDVPPFPDKKLADAEQRYSDAIQQAHETIDRANAAADQIDSSQTSATDTAGQQDSTSPAGYPGLMHIYGDYWWDTVNSKLIKIPGSAGNKVAPNKTKAGGKKPKAKRPKRSQKVKQAPTSGKRPGRSIRRPKPHIMKPRLLPYPQTQRLNTPTRNAVQRAHFQTKPPIKKPPNRRRPRALPKRPGARTR